MYCANCGKKVEPGERFCSECGKPVEEAEVRKKTFSPSALKSIVIIGVVLVAIIVLVAVLSGIRTSGVYSSPEAVAEAFYKALDREDAALMANLIDPYYLEENFIEKQELKKSLSQIIEVTKLFAEQFDYEVGEATVYNGNAEVEVTVSIEYNGGEIFTDTDHVETVRRDNKWYIGGDWICTETGMSLKSWSR